MSSVNPQVARFERYVEMDPGNATLWVGYGDALHGAGLFDRAEQAFRRSLEIESGNPIATARLAMLDISRHRFAAAEETLRKLIESGERHPAIVFNLGLSLYYAQRFAEAVEVFEQLVHVPGMDDARYYLVSCLHNLTKMDEAIGRAEAFLAERESCKLRGYLALLLVDHSRMSDALLHARRVLEEQPENPDAASVMSTHALETQQMEEAQHYLGVVTRREPRNVRALQGLALVALEASRHSEAIEYLERAKELDPANTGTFITLGWAHLTRHDYGRSERVFREGLNVDRNDAELHGGLACALLFQTRIDEAKQEIARAQGLDKACFGATFAQSVLLKMDGRDKLAARLLSEMLQKSTRPDGPTLLDGLVRFWRQRTPPAPERSDTGGGPP